MYYLYQINIVNCKYMLGILLCISSIGSVIGLVQITVIDQADNDSDLNSQNIFKTIMQALKNRAIKICF